MNRILVLPQRLARQLDLSVPHAIVSIRDPGDEFNFPARWGQRGVLPLYFRDLEPTNPEDVSALKLMTPDHARQAWAFIHEHADDIDTLVIHCWAGVSRSVGMALAVAGCMGVPPDRVEMKAPPLPNHNRYVEQLMWEGFSTPQPEPAAD